MSSALTHLRWLTDDFGVWQHTKGDEIHREMGYALDDSARALIVYLLYGDTKRAKVCLDYLVASKTPQGFVGFFDEHRKALDASSSDDAHALAIWALAEAIRQDFYAEEARTLLDQDQTMIAGLLQRGYIHTLAYLLLAYCALGDQSAADEVAQGLLTTFDAKVGWFGNQMTYANAVMPWSLLRYGQTFQPKNSKVIEKVVRQSIATLEDYCRIGVIPAPVGNRIWQRVGAVERDIYGQQPIDPGFMVLFLADAYTAYGEADLARRTDDWMRWFYGNNIYQTSLISPRHGCGDGLYALPRGVCNNKGAESVILYLWARYVHAQIWPLKHANHKTKE